MKAITEIFLYVLMVPSAVAAVIAFLLVLPFIPGAIDSLANRPNRYAFGWKSRFGFFTFLQPGRVKIIQRGEKFVRAIMDFDGHMFVGERPSNRYTPAHFEYWEVVPSKTHADSDPLPFPYPGERPTWPRYAQVGILWWRWKRLVYKRTGGVFTGIWPFQTVRVYPMERFKRVTAGNGKVTLERIEDYSDHYRVADFQYSIIVPEADTSDKIAVRVELNEVARVFNPYLTAYYTDDDWPTRFSATITDRVTSFTRPRRLDNVLSAKRADVEELGRYVTAGGQHEPTRSAKKRTMTEGSTCDFGVYIIRTQVQDISPSNPDTGTRLGDVAVARVDRAAAEQRAVGEAAYLLQEGKVLKDYPEATSVVQARAFEKAAASAGKNGTVILGGQALDPVQVAILDQLKKGAS